MHNTLFSPLEDTASSREAIVEPQSDKNPPKRSYSQTRQDLNSWQQEEQSVSCLPGQLPFMNWAWHLW